MSEFANRADEATDPARVRAYTAALVAALDGRDPLAVMRETPARLREAVAGVSPRELATPEAPGKWSMLQVVQHLGDSELVGAFRFRMVLAHDRPTLPGYDQDAWMDRLHAGDADPDAALDEFETRRRANLRLLERLAPADRARVGLHAERGEESLDRLLELYAGHDVVHLRQLARIRDAVRRGAPTG